MLCSVIIPTRKRLNKLTRAVASVFSTALDPTNVEVVLRIHSDDLETIQALPELLAMGNVKVAIGEPLKYGDSGTFYWEPCQLAVGRWVWMFNDDAMIDTSSDGWDGELSEIETSGWIVVPQTSRLGPSIYTLDQSCPFHLVPNRWWEQFGLKHFGHPIDNFVLDRLRHDAKWKTKFLPGLSVWHDRDELESLSEGMI